MNVALVGNQNSGKTTLFNALTGSNQKIGNWPGVTIERKEGTLLKTDDITIVTFLVSIHFHHIQVKKKYREIIC